MKNIQGFCSKKKYSSKVKESWTWWPVPAIPTLGRLRLEDCCEPEFSLGFRVKCAFQKKGQAGAMAQWATVLAP